MTLKWGREICITNFQGSQTALESTHFNAFPYLWTESYLDSPDPELPDLMISISKQRNEFID